jgi:transposase-like protein
MSENQCNHIHLVKQGGPMDGGVENSTRYRCPSCGTFFVVKPYEVTVHGIATPVMVRGRIGKL